MTLVYELSLDWFLGRHRAWQIFSVWQALKLPSQKSPMNETFPIFLEEFQPFGGLSTVKQSSHWVAGQTFDNRLPSRLQNMNENRAVWSV